MVRLYYQGKYTSIEFANMDFTYLKSSFFAQTNELASYKNALIQLELFN
jgi:hypothetical protein